MQESDHYHGSILASVASKNSNKKSNIEPDSNEKIIQMTRLIEKHEKNLLYWQKRVINLNNHIVLWDKNEIPI